MRHQIDTGVRYTSAINLFNVLKQYIKYVPAVPESVIIHHASSRKKKLLEQAQQSLQEKPLCDKDGRVRMFLKDDKYHENKIVAPRCIQYRNKRYCLRLACYLHPIESYVYTWMDRSGTPIFAKARNNNQRGQDIANKLAHFRNPVAISLDHSKFDAHVNLKLLDLEHKFYKSCNRNPELAYLLRMQRLNVGSTKNGTRYFTVGTRMSGDQNTGLGNSIINFVMTKSLFDHLKPCYYIDGDDFIIFVETEDAHLVDPELYKQFGMETKLDSSTSIIEEIEFCQSRPVLTNDGSYCMVRNPVRMLKRVQWAVGRMHPKHKINYITSVGLCLMSIGMGLPVAQFIGATMAALSGKYILTEYHYSASKQFKRPGKAHIVPPNYDVRLSFEKAWGISPHQQITIENSLINLDTVVKPCSFPQYARQEKSCIEDPTTSDPFWS